MKRVRYFAISAASLDFVDLMNGDERQKFIEWLLAATAGLYDGLQPQPIVNSSKLIRKATEAAIDDLVDVFTQYQKRASGNKGDQEQTNGEPVVDQCQTNGEPMVDQRPTYNENNEKDVTKKGEVTKPSVSAAAWEKIVKDALDENTRARLFVQEAHSMKTFPDTGMMNTYKKHGFVRMWLALCQAQRNGAEDIQKYTCNVAKVLTDTPEDATDRKERIDSMLYLAKAVFKMGKETEAQTVLYAIYPETKANKEFMNLVRESANQQPSVCPDLGF